MREGSGFYFKEIIEMEELSKIHQEICPLLEIISKGLRRIESFYNNKKYIEFSNKENLTEYEELQISFSYAVVTGINSAKILADKGFLLESFILCRSSLETIYLLEYLIRNPTKAKEIWNSTFYNAHPEILKVANITEKVKKYNFKNFIPSPFENDLMNIYTFLCKFSHPTAMTYFSYSQNPDFNFQRELIILNYYIISVLIEMYIDSQLDVGLFQNEQRKSLQELRDKIIAIRENYEPSWSRINDK